MKTFMATLASLMFAGLAQANITVNGSGKIVYVPDLAHVTVSVTSDGKTATEAWQKNGEIVKKLFKVLGDFKIADADMKTSGLNIQPKYIYPKDQEPRLVGYTASYDLTITVRNLPELGAVLDALVENGANRGMNIGFGCGDPDKLLDQARARAVADARRKADIYATGAGAELGSLVSISEFPPVTPHVLRYEHMAPAGDKGLIIAAGQQEMAVNLTVVYAIRNG
jgi:uncharacterized protein YggE